MNMRRHKAILYSIMRRKKSCWFMKRNKRGKKVMIMWSVRR